MPVRQQFLLMDLNGFGITSYSTIVKEHIKRISAMTSNSNPEQMYKNIIINSPMVFRGVWNVVKLMLDEGTRVKFTVVGSSYKKKLDAFIDDEWIADI